MATLEPRRVAPKDVLSWVKESINLIARRPVLYLVLVALFFLLQFLGIRAIQPIADELSPVVTLAVLFPYFALVLVLMVGAMVMSAYCSDHSRKGKAGDFTHTLVANQKALIKIAVLGLFVGAFFWVFSYAINPAKNLMNSCDKLVSSLVAQMDMPLGIELQMTASFLYFLMLAVFALRVFFSVPIILFHDANYSHAQSLSQRGIIINMLPMTLVIFLWSALLLGAVQGLSALSFVLLPLFANFVYVAYRHVFLGVSASLPARALSEKKHAEAALRV